jgi:hypothetical protein
MSLGKSEDTTLILLQRGFLLPSGLDELTDMALNKWRHDWKARREAEGKDGRLPVRFSKDSKEMWLLSSKDALGSINVGFPCHSVQGPNDLINLAGNHQRPSCHFSRCLRCHSSLQKPHSDEHRASHCRNKAFPRLCKPPT